VHRADRHQCWRHRSQRSSRERKRKRKKKGKGKGKKRGWRKATLSSATPQAMP
jgi:hypothetical protein